MTPSELRRAGWLAADYWPLALPALALVWGAFVWSAFGRYPGATQSVKPEYEPPTDLIPAQAGTIIDDRAHPRDVIATVVDLAVRGYLEIEPITTAFGEPYFMFKRLKPVAGDPDLRHRMAAVPGRRGVIEGALQEAGPIGPGGWPKGPDPRVGAAPRPPHAAGGP